MNICFFNDISIIGGGEHWVLRMVDWLARRGHSASVACPYRSALFQTCLARGIKVHGYQIDPGVPLLAPFSAFLRAQSVDLLYCTVIGRLCEARLLSDVVQVPGSEKRGPPIILKTGLPPIRALGAEYYGFGMPPVIRRLHVVSENSRREYLEWQGLKEGDENYVVRLAEGVDASRFSTGLRDRELERGHWGFSPDEQIVTCAARLHPQKGQDNLLLAFAEARKDHAALRLVLAGDGGERKRLESLARHLGLEDAVRFVGEVEDMPGLLIASDIFCHPSLADGMPNAVLEAMAMGLPVIASRVGGVPEIIVHEQNGLLVAPHDIHALIDGLHRLASNPEERRQLGLAATLKASDLDFGTCSETWLAAVTQEVTDYKRTTKRSPPRVRASVHPVLFVMTAMRTGGEETELALLARYLDRERYPLSVLSLYAVDEPSPASQRLGALAVPVDTVCHGLPEAEEKAAYLHAKILREGIRLVVACQDVAIAYCALQHVPADQCALIEHAGIAAEVSRVPKDRTARLVGVSREICAVAEPLFRESGRVRYLPSMVDFSAFESENRDSLRQAYGFKDDIVVLFVGRLDAKKGVDLLIDAGIELLPRHPEIRFVLVGPLDAFQQDYGRKLMQRAAALMPVDRFTFAGGRDDVPSLLCAADLLVLPALGEGMSHVINEAGAAGRAVIAFDDGAAREQLCDGHAGILVPSGDNHAFAEAIGSLATDRERRDQLGEALRQHVFREYSVQRVLGGWHALFGELGASLPLSPPQTAIRGHVESDLAFPAEIQIETNTVCNAHCIMCPYPQVSKELPNGSMSMALYRKILDECKDERQLWRIEPFLNNEPFTDRRMPELIALAKRCVPQAIVTITSNGSLLKPKVADALVKTGLDGIWFSFNGATKETYERIMGLQFDLVKRNIDYLLDIKPESLRVFTNMIETGPMRGEIAENIRYWNSRGVQSGSSPLVNRAGNVENFPELNYQPLAPQPVRVCELIGRKMYIGYNGDALLCCMDWRRQVVLGNAREQTLRGIWNGERYRYYRRMQAEGRWDELELCRDCSYIRN